MRLRTMVALLFLLLITWCLRTYHAGVLQPPRIKTSMHTSGKWIDKSELGIHQLILEGDAYGRGLKAGELTQNLLRKQEQELTSRLFELIPEPIVKILEIPLIFYFGGIEKYVDEWMLQEMYGVSKWAPKEYDRLIDSYTRQLAYHGLHEVGQMMVDQSGDDMGCTLVAAPFGRSWVLGRNFDFEGGPTLDREKIMKWVFPDNGFAYVSVIWAGMVGGVTAVNEQGIYLSINAAGSADARRLGMPTTLLLVKTLMAARTAEEAIAVLKSEPTFITDIFVLLDSNTGKLFRIEKSPLATEIVPLNGASVVTNHLTSPRFDQDRVNQFRKKQLTTLDRSRRAEALLQNPIFSQAKSSRDLELPILKIMRDKGEGPLALGNRKAIDALIAVHSVIFNSEEQTLYVSQGPALAGAFVGFDLKKSFQLRKPIVVRALPRDSVTDEMFEQVHASSQGLKVTSRQMAKNQCENAHRSLDQISYKESFSYAEVAGDYASACEHDEQKALKNWQEALERQPAYARDEARIRGKIAKGDKQ